MSLCADDHVVDNFSQRPVCGLLLHMLSAPRPPRPGVRCAYGACAAAAATELGRNFVMALASTKRASVRWSSSGTMADLQNSDADTHSRPTTGFRGISHKRPSTGGRCASTFSNGQHPRSQKEAFTSSSLVWTAEQHAWPRICDRPLSNLGCIFIELAQHDGVPVF